MNKHEAREFLGVSERTLQNLMAAGKIGFTTEQGKTGKVAKFERGDLERFKAERDTPVHRPAVQRMANDEGLQRDANTGGAELQSLAALPNAGQIEALGNLLAMLQKSQPEAPQPPARPSVNVADKLLLTLSEAQLLTGLSRSTLRVAIEEKKLKAQQIGRAWRIKRSDLDAYVKAL